MKYKTMDPKTVYRDIQHRIHVVGWVLHDAINSRPDHADAYMVETAALGLARICRDINMALNMSPDYIPKMPPPGCKCVEGYYGGSYNDWPEQLEEAAKRLEWEKEGTII